LLLLLLAPAITERMPDFVGHGEKTPRDAKHQDEATHRQGENRLAASRCDWAAGLLLFVTH
jgi:hypothetical protein